MLEPSPSSGLITDAGPGGIYIEAADDIARTAGEVETVGRHRRTLEIGFWLASIWILIVAFLAIFAPVLPFIDSPKKISADFKAPPSMEHWMGTDNIGRDIFSRVVYGGRISLTIAGAAIVLGLVVGGFFGLISGFYGKRTDRAVSTGTDILLAFPPLILTLAITSFLGVEHADKRGYFVILALAILSIAPLTRIVRASTLVYSNREFVLAARGLGAKNKRILFREVLPNVLPSMLSFALTGLALLIVAEGALAFLGQSVQVPTPTWGLMIFEGSKDLESAWWISMMPAAYMFLTILAFNVLGDVLSKRFDIRESLL